MFICFFPFYHGDGGDNDGVRMQTITMMVVKVMMKMVVKRLMAILLEIAPFYLPHMPLPF